MDFYANIHKSRGDKGSSIIPSSDPVLLQLFIPARANSATDEASLNAVRPQTPRRRREGFHVHYLLEVFKFIAQMMFLISAGAIN